MFYYRYRPLNARTIKELIYDKLYFVYPDELNDPVDGKIYYAFTPDEWKWERLPGEAWGKVKIDKNKIAKKLASISPISLEYITSNESPLTNILIESSHGIELPFIIYLSSLLKMFVLQRIPFGDSTVSFSKTGGEPLMWSHYADKHEGYCLIFRPFDNSLTPKKSSYGQRRNKDNNMHTLKFKDIKYDSISKNIDAFTLFSVNINGRSFTKEEHAEYWKQHELISRTKSECWRYESESRLILLTHLHDHYRHCTSERIYTYENHHIAGVIFGSRTTNKNKDIIKNILLDKSHERQFKKTQ
jgi:hypothetical protein